MKPNGGARIASSRCRPESWSVTGGGLIQITEYIWAKIR
jgi:hypothetical protein